MEVGIVFKQPEAVAVVGVIGWKSKLSSDVLFSPIFLVITRRKTVDNGKRIPM